MIWRWLIRPHGPMRAPFEWLPMPLIRVIERWTR